MKLTIISPQSKHSYSVQWIEAQSSAGALIIKPRHAPMILSLVAGSELSFMLSNHEKRIIGLMRPCFLEVSRTEVIALMGQDL